MPHKPLMQGRVPMAGAAASGELAAIELTQAGGRRSRKFLPLLGVEVWPSLILSQRVRFVGERTQSSPVSKGQRQPDRRHLRCPRFFNLTCIVRWADKR